MLEQTIELFKTAAEMGLNLKNIFALGKVYSNSAPVIETLRNMGVTVVESAIPNAGQFHPTVERDTHRLWQVAAEALGRRQIRRVLVLDDGGVCITSTPSQILQRYAVAGVEQTSLGMFLFEEKPPPFAVISWARSAVKLQIGGPIFSQRFIEKFNQDFLRGNALQGEQLGIIGMGSIGRALANLVVRQGNRVLFYDPCSDAQVPAALIDRVTRVSSLEELMLRCDYVIGCSGRNPFKNKWPLKHKPGVKLLSASGGDQEFGPIINDLKGKSDFNVNPHTWDITSEHGPSGPIQVAYLGYPYNFVSRAREAVPTPVVQIEIGGLLAALVQARFYLQMIEPTGEQNRGIHRVAPAAQRFVYETWVKAMKERQIDIIGVFGYDSALLNSIRNDTWFIENSEPHPGDHYTPLVELEEKMEQFVSQKCNVRSSTGTGR
ncbi:MAG TPA: NAD(P)-dependent oxidoreductase [Pyrinomonadaceae bacterium]